MSDKKTTLASRRHILKAAGLAIGAAASLGLKQARAAAYPERPIKIVVPFAAAGPTDIMARILAQSLGSALGGNFIVENKPGAGGNIGIGYAAHAAADGYTLLVVSTAYVVNPGLYAKIPYDPYKDFAPNYRTRLHAEFDPGDAQAQHQLDCGTDRTRQGQTR